MLSQTLKMLEQDGFILRTVYPVVPPQKSGISMTILGSQATKNELLDWLGKAEFAWDFGK